MSTLTRPQLLALAGLAILFSLDIAATLWGFFNLQVFYEVNPLLAPFCSMSTPHIFASVITGTKVAALAGIIAVTAWFNTWDQDRVSGGNVCCFGALGVYTVFMVGLAVVNSGRVFI